MIRSRGSLATSFPLRSLGASDLARLHQLSFWDALIIRAALQANCRVLLSEDMQDDRRIDGLRIVNPFRDLPKRK